VLLFSGQRAIYRTASGEAGQDRGHQCSSCIWKVRQWEQQRTAIKVLTAFCTNTVNITLEVRTGK